MMNFFHFLYPVFLLKKFLYLCMTSRMFFIPLVLIYKAVFLNIKFSWK